jgi:hypothetical protein
MRKPIFFPILIFFFLQSLEATPILAPVDSSVLEIQKIDVLLWTDSPENRARNWVEVEFEVFYLGDTPAVVTLVQDYYENPGFVRLEEDFSKHRVIAPEVILPQYQLEEAHISLTYAVPLMPGTNIIRYAHPLDGPLDSNIGYFDLYSVRPTWANAESEEIELSFKIIGREHQVKVREVIGRTNPKVQEAGQIRATPHRGGFLYGIKDGYIHIDGLKVSLEGEFQPLNSGWTAKFFEVDLATGPPWPGRHQGEMDQGDYDSFLYYFTATLQGEEYQPDYPQDYR